MSSLPPSILRDRARPGKLTRPGAVQQGRAMRATVLACLVLLAPTAWAPHAWAPHAWAQKPAPLPPGVDDTPRAGKTPYSGPQATGKPPPLGAPGGGGGGGGGGGSPFADAPRVPPSDRNDRPPSGSERASSSGTGFVVAPGRLLTNNHVVADCNRVTARNAQNVRESARVLATDRRRDLALLEVPTALGPPLPFRDAPPVRRGESVVTYGFPLSGLLSSGPTLTSGDISALAGLRDNPVNFQISAPVQPGNSGGPLLDSQANVIGVIVSKLNAARIAEMTGGDIPQNVNFAVKGTEALTFLRANRVEPRIVASTGADKRNFEVGEVANPSTMYLQCFR